MKVFSKCLLGMSVILASLAFGGEGTLPFGKGQVPFSMIGKADDGGRANSMRLSFEPKRLRTGSAAEAQANCPSGMRAYNFGGKVSLNGLSYSVTAICASGQNSGSRMIAGQSGSSKITLDGYLSRDSDGVQTFTGTAKVKRSNQTRRYNFTLSE